MRVKMLAYANNILLLSDNIITLTRMIKVY